MTNLIPLLARLLLAAVFLHSAWGQAMGPAGTQHEIAAHGIPLPPLFYVGALALQALGGLSVLLGWRARWGALALIVFLIPTTLLFHTDFADQNQVFNFTKNVAIIGGLLLLIRYGPGRWSLDGLRGGQGPARAARGEPLSRAMGGEEGDETSQGRREDEPVASARR